MAPKVSKEFIELDLKNTNRLLNIEKTQLEREVKKLQKEVEQLKSKLLKQDIPKKELTDEEKKEQLLKRKQTIEKNKLKASEIEDLRKLNIELQKKVVHNL